MANYRPKSLDELNNLYDRSMAAQTAIQKSGSAIANSDAEEIKEKAVKVEEAPVIKEKTASQVASEELAEKVDSFIKSFGENKKEAVEAPAPVQVVPVPIKKAVKSAPAKPKTKKAAEETADKKVVQKVSAQSTAPKAKEKTDKAKEDEARSLERDELFNDYIRIMNDEDEDSSALKSKFRKKGKKEKHQGSPLDEEAEQKLAEEIKAEPEKEAQQNEQEPEKEKKAKKEKKDKKAKQEAAAEEEIEEEISKEAVQEAPAEEKIQPEAEEAQAIEPEDEQEAQPSDVKKKSKKHTVAQIFLMLILLGVLCLSLVVGLLKVVVGVDTAKPFFNEYYVFTAEKTYVDAGINKGDLIITEKKNAAENEALAFIDISSNTVNFGTRGSLLDSQNYMVHSDSGVSLVNEATARGVVTAKIPVLGDVVRAAMENFIVVIVVLVVLALILILILALAFRSSSNYEEEAFDDYEDEDEEDEYDDDNDEEDYDDEEYGDDDEYYENEEYDDEDEDDYEPSEDDRLFSIKN